MAGKARSPVSYKAQRQHAQKKQRRRARLTMCLLLALCIFALPLVLRVGGVVGEAAPQPTRESRGSELTELKKVVPQHVVTGVNAVPPVNFSAAVSSETKQEPEADDRGGGEENNNDDDDAVGDGKGENVTTDANDEVDGGEIDEREEAENTAVRSLNGGAAAENRGEERGKSTEMPTTNTTTVTSVAPESQILVDADGKPLTNGAGVAFRHPFNGVCIMRDAALLSPRPREYDPRNHLVVIGIISLDNEDHHKLRMAQRDTWFTYKDVATVRNGFHAQVLVEYVVGLAYENKFKYSKLLKNEAATHKDILGVNLKEMKRKVKSVLTTGKYGKGPEVIMTFKTLAFYCYAEKTYTKAKYIIKGDDDQFMRIPVILRTTLTLPATGVIWGRMNRPRPSKQHRRRFCGTSGMLVGLSRDVVSLVNHYEPVQKFARVNPDAPFVPGMGKVTLQWIYSNTGLYAEDIVAAYVIDSTRMLRETKYIHFYNDMPCRLHNHNAEKKGRFAYFVNPFSMVIHHANRTEQFHYMKLFPEEKVYNTTFPFTKRRHPRGCYKRAIFQTHICNSPEAQIHL